MQCSVVVRRTDVLPGSSVVDEEVREGCAGGKVSDTGEPGPAEGE